MLRLYCFTLCFGLFLTLRPAAAQDYDFSRIDQLLQDSVEQIAGLGGGVNLMLWKDGEIIYNRSFNKADKDYSETTLVPIASASKWLSGAVIMALVDQGKLSLDTRAGDFFSGLDDDHAAMTLRQMFSHTSGMPDNDHSSVDCLNQRKFEGGLAACVDEVLQEDLVAAPGAQFAYGGNSMHVAGRIAEIVYAPGQPTGDAWDSMFDELITGPLNMPRSSYDAPLTRGDNPLISGGAWSTGAEYMNFLVMLLQGGVFDGERVLTEAAIETMLADQTGGATIVYSPYQPYFWLDASLPGTRYGVGVWREVLDNKGVLTEASSQGAFGFSPWIDRERNLAGVLSVFSTLGAVYPTYYTLKQMIREEIPLETTAVEENETSATELKVFPQPAEDFVHIELRELEIDAPQLWTLRAQDGRLVRSGTIENGAPAFEIDLRELAAGVYALNIFGAADARMIRRLITVH